MISRRCAAITEYLTYPYRKSDRKLINGFYSFLEDMDIFVKEIDRHVADKAAQIRAELRQFQELDCITVEEWGGRIC